MPELKRSLERSQGAYWAERSWRTGPTPTEMSDLKRLLDFKKKEAIFRSTVNSAHRLFCDCEDPLKHLLQWRISSGGDTTVTTEGTDEGIHTGDGSTGDGSGVAGG